MFFALAYAKAERSDDWQTVLADGFVRHGETEAFARANLLITLEDFGQDPDDYDIAVRFAG